ncbi:thiamine phosphate synthase [Metabacillus sp. GX 13764]|uniref:thiamine phosphate synthase n=1 Tax=Metabacillus kandeliae TaxID=2900151 RepID=UPI001E30212E|nr:thiamine phosphate synthase [Metabacillus kandeliae]MCD7035053.1 thiamine phosphate synthase [Metabacillus kandeliae]
MSQDSEIKSALRVYFIAGTQDCSKDAAEVLKEAIEGGITMFQFREKGEGSLSGREKEELAKKLQSICRSHKVPFIVNDDLELAVKIGADGLHIGQDDENAGAARESMKNKWLGVSVHTEQEAEQAIADGADYLGIGPIFPTESKKDAKEVQGTVLIEAIRKKGITIPVVGIGGINEHNAQMVMKAGADGAAVISAISRAPDIARAAESLRKKL